MGAERDVSSALPGHDRAASSSRSGSSRPRRRRGAATRSARSGMVARDRRHAAKTRRARDVADRSRARCDRRRLRSGRGATREDDRDAADGGAVQRRRRRRGGAGRARRVPRARAGAGRIHGDISVAIVLSALIGSISFAGSLVAFAKLQELIQGRPITYPGQKIVNARCSSARSPRGVAIVAGCRARVAALGADRRRAALRRPVRAADRRRRHAGRDLAAERVHRPRRGGDRLRAREQRADRERHARRRVRHVPDADDGPGDEPLDRERPLRRVRAGRRRGGGAAARRRTAPCARRPPTTSPSCSPTRSKVVVVPGLRDGGRAGAARRARARRPARGARRRGHATRSTRSPGACRAT